MQSVEISHKIGIGMLVFELHSFPGEYIVTLENVIATNNSCPYCGGDQKLKESFMQLVSLI